MERCLLFSHKIIITRDLFSDLHGMGELTFTQGWHANRKHRGGLPWRSQAYALARGHLRRDPPKTGSWQDEVPQDCQRQQGSRLHRQQGCQAGLHRRRRCLIMPIRNY
jgi:hypothetical protein